MVLMLTVYTGLSCGDELHWGDLRQHQQRDQFGNTRQSSGISNYNY